MWISPAKLTKLGIMGMNCRNVEFIAPCNKRKLFPLVDDKLKTKVLAEKHGLPVSRLRSVIRHQFEVRHLERRLETMQGFAIKPAKGSGGRGILIISGRRDGAFLKASGKALDIHDLQRHVSNILAGLYSLSGAPDVAIVEDLIEFDDLFHGYSHEGIPDLRTLVYQGYPVMAMLRLATHASDGKANLHMGAVGVGMDLATGRCLHAVQNGRAVLTHPDTGRALKDIRIPDWPDILELAARCYEMTGLGYLGTDVVLDKTRGPLLLELNARPGLAIQIANGMGLLPVLRKVEQLAEIPRPPEERVRLAMNGFEAGKIGRVSGERAPLPLRFGT